MNNNHKIGNLGEIRHLTKTLMDSRLKEIKTVKLCWLVILALLFGGLKNVGVARAQTFELAFGTFGGGDGRFNEPSGIALDGSGNFYVADTGNHRIQKFSSNGAFILSFGTQGSGDGAFIQPSGIAVDGSGNFYVADEFNRRRCLKELRVRHE